MIALWIRAGCLLLGHNALGVRIGVVLASLLTRLFVWRASRRVVGVGPGRTALIITSITPLAVAGGFLATYDVLLVLFWAMGVWAAGRALFPAPGRPQGAPGDWAALGAAFGLGLLSKHTMILLAPCLLLFLLTSPERRRLLRTPGPWAALALGFALFAPNLVWQAQNHWMTFGHLMHLSGKGSDHHALRRLGDFVGSQAGLLTPFLFAGLIAATLHAARRVNREGDAGTWFACCVSAPVLAFFILMTFKAKVQANWAVCGWLMPAAIYGRWRVGRVSPIWERIGLGVCLAMTLLIAVPQARVALGVRIPPRMDQTNKLYGGSEVAAAAARLRDAMRTEGQAVTIGAATYDIASRVAFYLPDQSPVRCFFLGTRANAYMTWNHEAGPAPGGDAVVVDDVPPEHPIFDEYRRIFGSVEFVGPPVQVYRSGIHAEPVHTYYLYRCRGYRPDAAAERTEGG